RQSLLLHVLVRIARGVCAPPSSSPPLSRIPDLHQAEENAMTSTPATKILSRDAQADQDVLQPLPASRKTYVTGSRADLRVAMREVDQSVTQVAGQGGTRE